MTFSAHLSSKLPLVSQHGFALLHSRQPHYEFEWHTHDCAMLLWPQVGSLRSAWLGEGGDSLAQASRATLSRDTAVLLPRATAHHTLSGTQRQQHGELYLAPELLRGFDDTARALHLDGATVAMLDALLAPALTPRSAEHLVRAIAGQLMSARSVALPLVRHSLAQRMTRGFALALEGDGAMPSVDAVACELGVSTRQLQRACQQELGASPVEVRRRMLAAHARTLLAGGQPFAEVSLQLGFVTSGHLGRLLRGVGVPD